MADSIEMFLLLFTRLKLDNLAGCWLALGCNSLSKIQCYVTW